MEDHQSPSPPAAPEVPATDGPDASSDEHELTFNPAQLACIIESLLFAAGSPVPLRRLVEVLAGPSTAEVREAVELLREQYAPGKRGIQLVEVAGGYQFRTAREYAVWVQALLQEKPQRLGRAALETLAIVAYKQPVTKAEIEAIRGVDCDGPLNTLLSRRLIKIAGRKETVGRPLLYATTPEFLETFGLRDLHDLPALQELSSALESLSAPESTDEDVTAQQTTLPLADSEQTTTADQQSAAEADRPPATSAKDPRPGGPGLATTSGAVDPRGAGAGERPGGNGAGREG
ncbi:MAG: SMC-Scp complex subunit ScpB [Candidatus Binatia bacterium]|nr:SMC-Scp complex subunit ScpB [Candidatus Binatia bacterium]